MGCVGPTGCKSASARQAPLLGSEGVSREKQLGEKQKEPEPERTYSLTGTGSRIRTHSLMEEVMSGVLGGGLLNLGHLVCHAVPRSLALGSRQPQNQKNLSSLRNPEVSL